MRRASAWAFAALSAFSVCLVSLPASAAPGHGFRGRAFAARGFVRPHAPWRLQPHRHHRHRFVHRHRRFGGPFAFVGAGLYGGYAYGGYAYGSAGAVVVDPDPPVAPEPGVIAVAGIRPPPPSAPAILVRGEGGRWHRQGEAAFLDADDGPRIVRGRGRR